MLDDQQNDLLINKSKLLYQKMAYENIPLTEELLYVHVYIMLQKTF